jgi:transcriptional regulator with XRE-family HTH domain
MVTSEQVRAARALLRWEQKDLANASTVSLPSIQRLETKPGPLAAQARTLAAIRAALESAGVIFVDENGEGQGVRLRKGGAPGTKAASIPIEDLNAENDE